MGVKTRIVYNETQMTLRNDFFDFKVTSQLINKWFKCTDIVDAYYKNTICITPGSMFLSFFRLPGNGKSVSQLL